MLKIIENYELWYDRLNRVGLEKEQAREVVDLVIQSEKYQLAQIEMLIERLNALEKQP